MRVCKIPEQTGPDVEQKLKTMSGGEFDVPGGVPRGARSRGPQFTPRQRFATFALRLQPFASEFRRRSPVCSENDAFRERNGDLNFRNGAPVCSENGASFRRDSDPNGNHRFAAKRVSFLQLRGPERAARTHLPDPGRVPRGTLFLTTTRTLRGDLC